MHEPDNNPEKLISVPNEFEAAMIVSALAARNIDATTSGSFTAGFRAEAPGDVQVLVRRRDLAKAKRALRELEPRPASEPTQHSHVATTLFGEMTDLSHWLTVVIVIVLAVGILQSCL